MKLRDLTEEQVQKICDYYNNKYDNGKTDLGSICKPCQHCPFGYAVDDSCWRECSGFFGFQEFDERTEEKIKEILKDD